MNRRQFAFVASAGVALGGLGGAWAAEPPPSTWDGLVRVPSKKFRLVYLAPKVDFRPYAKVIVDPTEIAFDKNWIRDYNEQSMGMSLRVDSTFIRNTVTEGVKRASAIFEKAFADGGYPVVTAPGPDVLRVRTAVIDIQVYAPDVMTSMGRTFSAAGAAGSAKLVVEVRDSQTGAILGRAIDARWAGNYGTVLRNSVTDWSDFEQLVKDWAKASVVGLNELKTLAPAPAGGPAG